MPTVLAQVTAAPDGTEKLVDPNVGWQTANVGDYLYDDSQIRNRKGNTYGVELKSEVELSFPDGAASVLFGKITGEGKYEDENQNWHPISSSQQVTALAVDSAKKSLIPTSIQGTRGFVKPKPWGGS